MALGSIVLEILKSPSPGAVVLELAVLMVPVWVALFFGVLVGWVWRPKWANLAGGVSDGPSPPTTTSSSGQASSPQRLVSSEGAGDKKICVGPPAAIPNCSTVKAEKDESGLVNADDLEHLCRLVEVKDGGPAWIQMMDRSTATMSYQAWRRDPETGPPQYRSRTVFEDASPELLRDLFWDDDYRQKWDDMLLSASTLEECPTTGTMMVQWVRKGVPCSTVPRRNKPRRVDLYYSSWCIRAVESKRGNGQLTSCEVILFHHEDMGIPWEIAKLGIRQGMWGAVKKIEPGLRSYQKERASGEAAISRCAFMAQINTKVSADYLSSLDNNSGSSGESAAIVDDKTRDSTEKNQLGKNVQKVLVFGGAIILACSLDRGLLTKAAIFGAARRFGQIGRR